MCGAGSSVRLLTRQHAPAAFPILCTPTQLKHETSVSQPRSWLPLPHPAQTIASLWPRPTFLGVKVARGGRGAQRLLGLLPPTEGDGRGAPGCTQEQRRGQGTATCGG